MSPLLNV